MSVPDNNCVRNDDICYHAIDLIITTRRKEFLVSQRKQLQKNDVTYCIITSTMTGLQTLTVQIFVLWEAGPKVTLYYIFENYIRLVLS